MVTLTIKTSHAHTDQLKANECNKFIGKGSINSSTNQYRKDYGGMANTGSYTKDDIVFISAEGNRKGRLNPDFNEIALAISVGVTFVTDNHSNRNRSYNIGERQVAEYLIANGYEEHEQNQPFSAWFPSEN